MFMGADGQNGHDLTKESGSEPKENGTQNPRIGTEKVRIKSKNRRETSNPRFDQQVGDLAVHCFCNPDKAIQGQVLLAPLNKPDIIAMTVGQLSQLLL